MDEAELHQELQDLLKTQDALQNSLNKAQDESDVDDLVKQAEAENKALKAKRSSQVEAAPPKENLSKSMLEAIEGLGAAITNIKSTMPEDDKSFCLDFSGESL
jgi:DNA gyrase/topoisomerase IV subunit A